MWHHYTEFPSSFEGARRAEGHDSDANGVQKRCGRTIVILQFLNDTISSDEVIGLNDLKPLEVLCCTAGHY
jgi:hypothetical protein